jgi:hypothetical protein
MPFFPSSGGTAAGTTGFRDEEMVGRQTVLNAFQQEEDSLAGVGLLSQQVIREREAVRPAETSLKLESGRYETGIDPFCLW